VLISGGPDPTSAALRLTAVVVTVVVLVAGAVLATRHPVARPWFALLIGDGAVLLLGHVFFPYYSSFTSAPIALVVGSALALVPLTALATGAALAACAWSAWQLPSPERTVDRTALRAQIGHARCVAADSAAVLVAEDVLTRDLDRGCPVIIDVTGTAYDSDRGQLSSAAGGVQRLHAPRYQALMRRYFAASDAVIVARPAADGFTAATKSALRRQLPDAVRIGGATVYDSCSAKCS
jgi:alpha-1,2-mannosyltransferase